MRFVSAVGLTRARAAIKNPFSTVIAAVATEGKRRRSSAVAATETTANFEEDGDSALGRSFLLYIGTNASLCDGYVRSGPWGLEFTLCA